jgi:hypothetical protein
VKTAAIALLSLAVLLLIAPGAKRSAEATANPLPPLITCPNLDASPDNKVTVADILVVVQHYNKSYGQAGYEYLWDTVSPYNSTSPAGTGTINVADILYSVNGYGQTCPLMDTQLAAATRAIADPLFSSTLCDNDDTPYVDVVNCGGDAQFLTQNNAFLLSRGYRQAGGDVPGQGVHFVNISLWDGVFNPARPEGLVYNDGVLSAQLYNVDGDVVGWGPDPDNNDGAVNTDIFCTPVANEPPGTGCGWAGTNDGWHWHADLCTIGIGTSNPLLNRFPTQQECSDWGTQQGITCTFPSAPNYNCNWDHSVGWMGHLWNWLPNANYSNAVVPTECQPAYCATFESNGRFSDCFPDTQGWNAYNCPQ